MTEQIRKALDLYKVWVTKFHFHEGMTQEDWIQFYTGEGMDTDETKFAICKASSDSYFAFLHFFFLGMVLFPVSCTMSQM